jgi:peptide-methionine (S)-S-oxide reductase
MRLFGGGRSAMVEPEKALPGRDQPIAPGDRHEVLGTPLKGPFPAGVQSAVFGMGCFWGAERIFWQAPGIHSTAVGYAGGITPNPTYEEVCSGRTGHAEVVLVAFDAAVTSYADMLKLFWEGHDPTEGMRQGNDVGTQYRSAILWQGEAQRDEAIASASAYQRVLSDAGHREITSEIAELDAAHPFYYAEAYHQQYLAKNPGGYDCAAGTGIACPIGLSVSRSTADQRSVSSSQ